MEIMEPAWASKAIWTGVLPSVGSLPPPLTRRLDGGTERTPQF